MNYVEEREAIGEVFSSWAPPGALVVFSPNQKFSPPTPNGSINAPAVYLTWDVEYLFSEHLTFECVRIEGEVSAIVHVEHGARDGRARELFDALVQAFHSAKPAGEMGFSVPLPGQRVKDEEFDRRDLRIPFDRFTDSSDPALVA